MGVPDNWKGYIDKLVYISSSEYWFDGREKPVVCTVSLDRTVHAWDLLEGMEIWSSPLQPAALVNLVSYPQLQLVVTVDTQGLIKAWKAEMGQEWASFYLPTYPSALEACGHPEGRFPLVACAEGNLYTLVLPQLQLISKVTAFPNSPIKLMYSSDCKWVYVSTQNSHPYPKVFYTLSLLFLSEDETPASTTLSIWLSFHAYWAPDEASRLIVMHRNDNGMQLIISTYELRAKKSREEVDILDLAQVSDGNRVPWLYGVSLVENSLHLTQVGIICNENSVPL